MTMFSAAPLLCSVVRGCVFARTPYAAAAPVRRARHSLFSFLSFFLSFVNMYDVVRVDVIRAAPFLAGWRTRRLRRIVIHRPGRRYRLCIFLFDLNYRQPDPTPPLPPPTCRPPLIDAGDPRSRFHLPPRDGQTLGALSHRCLGPIMEPFNPVGSAAGAHAPPCPPAPPHTPPTPPRWPVTDPTRLKCAQSRANGIPKYAGGILIAF